MTNTRFAIIALVFSAAAALGNQTQAQIYSESFESDPGAGYTLSVIFDDGFDFFGRYAVPDVTNGARDDFTGGFDGGFAIFAQDLDGTGEAATQTVDIAGIDISGQTDLSTTISFGALNSEPDFSNYEAADADGVQIFASIDGGTSTLIGEFAANDTGASDLYLDTDGDGIGDGANLTTELADFTFDIAGAGASLDLSIAFTSTGSFEPIVADNVRVFAAVPEPGSAALIGLVAFAGLCRRRRN